MSKIEIIKNTILIFTLFTLVSCSMIGLDDNDEDNIRPVNNFAYPISTGQIENYNNNDNSDYYLPSLIIPTPSSESSVVYGRLLILSENDSPYLAPSLFLGKLLQPDDGVSETLFMVSLSIDEDPKAEQAIDGSFVFSNVPEGQYALTIWMPTSTFIFNDAKTNEPVIFDVLGGESLNLGNLYVP